MLRRGDEVFASSVVRFRCHARGRNETRLVVPVRWGDLGTDDEAVVDTGALWCLLHPETAAELELRVDAANRTVVVIAGHRFEGTLHRVEVTLLAEQGDPVSLQSTTFVPLWDRGEPFPLPNFLGLEGCLMRLRTALDPMREECCFAQP